MAQAMEEYSIPEMCDLEGDSLLALYINASNGSGGGNLVEGGFEAFSSSHATACAQHRFDLVVSLVVPVVFAAIVVLGVVGNVLVLAVVLCGQQMRNTTNVLILVS